jgi:hypothetical protein
MRLFEFADAEAQLALLRTIIDNTWTAVSQQAEQKKRADAERKAQAKLKPRAKNVNKGASLRIPTPPAPPPKTPQASLAQQPPPVQSKPTPNTASALTPLPSTYPQLKPLPTVTAVQSTPSTIKPITPSTVAPKNRPNQPNTAALGRNISAVKKDDDTDDRHSKNGIATLKKLTHSFEGYTELYR